MAIRPSVSRSSFLKQVFFVVGPTASGKSELAADVAARCGAEIVSADAFQLYRSLPLLTAQPDATLLRKVRHYLIASVPLIEEMSAEKFRTMALAAIGEVHGRGKSVIVTGGSGLYVKALTHGLAPLPAVDPRLRDELNALSLEEINIRLAAVDPLGVQTIDRKNKRRLVRALEISLQTNEPASARRSQWSSSDQQVAGVFVFRERDDLHERINRRVEQMFNRGVIEEARVLGELSATAAKTLGLTQLRQLLEGKISEAGCIAAIQQATRRYAKRQLTWFRRQTNFESLNLSLLKDHEGAVDWILQKILSFASAE